MREAARRSKEQASWPHPRAARRPGWKEAVSIKVTEESVSAGGRGEGGQLRPRRACGWSGPGHSSGTRACAEGGTGFRSQQQRRGHVHWTPVLTTPSAEGERTAGHPRTERGREGAGEAAGEAGRGRTWGRPRGRMAGEDGQTESGPAQPRSAARPHLHTLGACGQLHGRRERAAEERKRRTANRRVSPGCPGAPLPRGTCSPFPSLVPSRISQVGREMPP